jgi:general secretion pathway protein N
MPEPVLLDAGRRQATLSPGAIALPASLLAGLGAPFNTLDLQGAMQLDWSAWRLFGDQAFGQLVLNFSEVASRVSRVKPLGSYRVVLDAAGSSASLRLSTLRGPLLLQGTGQLAGHAVSFQGTASAAPGAQDSLNGLLNILGRRVADNRYALNLQR